MKLPQFVLVLTFAGSCSFTSRATVLSDWQTGSQIVVPDNWKTSPAPIERLPGFSASAYNPLDTSTVSFVVDDQLTQQPLTEKLDYVQDFIRDIQSQNSIITGRDNRTVSGTPFVVISSYVKTSGPHARYMTAWFTILKGHVCQICLQKRDESPDKSDALNKVIQSFTKTDHVLAQNPVPDRQAQLDQSLKDNPFSFYGIVVDENNNPVVGATIKVLVLGELENGHADTAHNLQSDQSGLFKLENVHSNGVIVTVAKDGFVMMPDGHGPWDWFPGRTKSDSMPTKEHPTIFRLQKKGP